MQNVNALLFVVLSTLAVGCTTVQHTPDAATTDSAREDLAAAPLKPAPPNIPPLFTQLFERGKTFSYSVSERVEHFDGDTPQRSSSAKPDATCRVETTGQVGPAVTWAHLKCDVERLNTVFVVSPQGIWLTGAPPTPDTMGQLTQEKPHLAIPPAPYETVTEGESPDEGTTGRSAIQTTQGWCVRNFTAMGDESWETICFREGVGMTQISHGFAGGSTRETTYTLKP